MLHISYNTPRVPVMKVDKVKAVMDLLIPRFRQYYSPSVNFSIDKTMVGFRGRFSVLQYIPNKPTKWGIKAFSMVDGANGATRSMSGEALQYLSNLIALPRNTAILVTGNFY